MRANGRRDAAWRRIVVGFDGTREGKAAVDRALAMAGTDGPWEVVLVCTHDRPADFSKHTFLGMPVRDRVWPGMPVPAGAWLIEWDRRVRAELDHEVKRIRLAGVDADAVCARDDPAELLLHVAREVGAERILLCEERHGWLYELVLGSTARRLVRHSDIPVTVVSEDGPQEVAA